MEGGRLHRQARIKKGHLAVGGQIDCFPKHFAKQEPDFVISELPSLTALVCAAGESLGDQ